MSEKQEMMEIQAITNEYTLNAYKWLIIKRICFRALSILATALTVLAPFIQGVFEIWI